MSDKIGILVGGGPAPGINSVIAAATIRCQLDGCSVLGIRDGFSGIMKGDTRNVTPLEIEDVSRIHFRGGSCLRTSRANPTRDDERLTNTVVALKELGVTALITIGGDDTAFSAMRVAERAAGSIRVAHVPKTIDNDLSLPDNVDTFGYQTARHWGVKIVQNLMVDAATTSRWYFAIAMGRKAGHLALGIGKAAGATLTLIPEEFGDEPVRLSTIVDTLAGAIIKRRALGQANGVAVIAEGVVLGIRPEELAVLHTAERDEHGHVRIAEIEIGPILKRAVKARLADLGIIMTIVEKNIGYELRCADPIPVDMAYTRDLGYCVARFLLDGGSGAMVTIQGGNFVPVPFSEMIDPETGRTKIRMANVQSTRYAIARHYMIRLNRADFEGDLARLAATAGLSADAFREQFEHVVQHES